MLEVYNVVSNAAESSSSVTCCDLCRVRLVTSTSTSTERYSVTATVPYARRSRTMSHKAVYVVKSKVRILCK